MLESYMTHSFIPADFDVPESITADNFYLTILAPAVAEIDYEAVMSSRARLRSVFGVNTEWPRDSMTLEDNFSDLINHESEFQSRKAFAYSVLTRSKNKCIGSIYIDPSKVGEFDVEVYLWVRDDSVQLDNELYEFTSHWLRRCWPFKKIAFPGRDFSWEEWGSFEIRV